MSTGWENHEPAPMEFFHSRLMDLFHEWRLTKTTDVDVMINGGEFGDIVVRAKRETYAKYPKQNLKEAILKTDI